MASSNPGVHIPEGEYTAKCQYNMARLAQDAMGLQPSRA